MAANTAVNDGFAFDAQALSSVALLSPQGAAGLASQGASLDPNACCEPCVEAPGSCAGGTDPSIKPHVCLDPDCARCRATAGTATALADLPAPSKQRTHACLDPSCVQCRSTAGQQPLLLQPERPKQRTHACLDPGCDRCRATGPAAASLRLDSPKTPTHACLDPDCVRCKATLGAPQPVWDQDARDRPGKHACIDPDCARCKATAQAPPPNTIPLGDGKRRAHACLDPDCVRCKATAQPPPNPIPTGDDKPRPHVCMDPDCSRCKSTAQQPPHPIPFRDGKPRVHACMDPDCERCLASARLRPAHEPRLDAPVPKMHVCGDADCARCKATGVVQPASTVKLDQPPPKIHVCLDPGCERCKATAQPIGNEVLRFYEEPSSMHVCIEPDCVECRATAGLEPLASWNVPLESPAGPPPPPASGSIGTAGPKDNTESCLDGQITPGAALSTIPITFTNPVPWSGAGWQLHIPLSGDRCEERVDSTTTDHGPLADFLDVTSSPIIVGCWLLFTLHYQRGCDGPRYRDALVGLYLPDVYTSAGPQLYVLNEDGAATEGTLLFDPVAEVVYWPHAGRPVPAAGLQTSALTVVSAIDFTTVAQHVGEDSNRNPMYVGADSSGVLTSAGYVFGTVNPPGDTSLCNNTAGVVNSGSPFEKQHCGAVMLANYGAGAATIVEQVDYAVGYRSWVGGSVSADSTDALFVGNTSQYGHHPQSLPFTIDMFGRLQVGGYHNDVFETHGFTDFLGTPVALYEDRYGCTVARIDALAAGIPFSLSTFDPGDVTNCRTNPEDDFKSSVAGEVVVTDDDVVWAQFTSNNYRLKWRDQYQVYSLDAGTLTPNCEFVMPGGTSDFKAASFYQAPTLANAGLGYALFALPDFTTSVIGDPALKIPHTGFTRLMRMSQSRVEGCQTELYDAISEEEAYHSPTLVSGDHGDYVLVATGDALYVYDQHYSSPAPLMSLPLGHGHPHVSTPVFHHAPGLPGTVFLLSDKGDLSILPSPLVGQGPQGEEVSISLRGYGDALWPRFRADNCGSGRPSSGCP